MTHWRVFALTAAGFCLSPALALAQNPNNEARAAFQDGVRQYGAHHYAEALEAFRTAYRVRPHPSVLVNIANCQLALNQPQQALGTFERYLTDASPTLSPEQRTDIQNAMAEARRHLATINVVVQPAGAEVYLDGDLVGTAPLRRPVETGAGPHVLEARMSGMASQQFQARVEGGGSVTVTLDLAAGRVISGTEAATATGAAAALAAGAATAATANPPPAVVPAPQPRVVVPAPAVATPVPTPVVVPPAGGTAAVPGPIVVPGPVPNPARPPDHRPFTVPVAFWVGGAVTVAAAATAIGFGVYASSETTDYNNVVTERNNDIALLRGQVPGVGPLNATQRAQLAQNVDILGQRGLAISNSYDQNHTLAWVFGGVAIAGGVFTVGSLFLWPRPAARANSTAGLGSLRVLPSPDGRGVLVGGAF